MKNFIELTDSNDGKIIINVNSISSVAKNDNSRYPNSKTTIHLSGSSTALKIKESYDEVRATIERAQGIQTVPSGGINIA